ncbi:MAG: DUF3592 domain-containing protein [Kovacikia sp.]
MNSKPQQNNLEEKLSAIIGLVLGILFIAGGFWVRSIEAHDRATLQETQGTVVDHIRRRDRATSTQQERETYAPVIEFLDNGQPTRFTGNYESYRTSQGNRVVVRYDPTQPTNTARVVDPLEGLTTWGMFGLGGLATICSLGTLLSIRPWFSGEQRSDG